MKFRKVIFSFLVLFGSCSKTDKLTQVFVGEEFTLGAGERLDLMDTTRFLAEIEILDINDSRCPVNAQCIRAGEAIVTVGLIGKNEKLVVQTLCIGDCTMTGSVGTLNDKVTINVGDLLVTLILVRVEPYPSLDDQDPGKNAIMIFESYSLP